ncbi:hypothetical protein ACFYNW_18520 [Streptomyces virginiae]
MSTTAHPRFAEALSAWVGELVGHAGAAVAAVREVPGRSEG